MNRALSKFVDLAHPNDREIFERVVVPISGHIMTAMAFHRTTPAPWTNGNTLEFRVHRPASPEHPEEQTSWRAINIHAENFHEIVGRLGIKSVELHVLHTTRLPSEVQETGKPTRTVMMDQGYAVVTDRRIPRTSARTPATT